MFGLSALTTKLILGGIVAAALLTGALYIKHVIAQNAVLSSQLDQAVATNKANLSAFAEYKDAEAKALQALADQHAADMARINRDSKLKEQIAREKPTGDGPVSPVLAHVLDSLRNRPAANPSPN